MDVVIVGGGRMGSHLAQELLTNGHSVRLIENRSIGFGTFTVRDAG